MTIAAHIPSWDVLIARWSNMMVCLNSSCRVFGHCWNCLVFLIACIGPAQESRKHEAGQDMNC